MIGRVYRWRDACWIVIARGAPFDRGPRRNVLLERVVRVYDFLGAGVAYRGETVYLDRDERLWVSAGERTVRPFRGLRRA